MPVKPGDRQPDYRDEVIAKGREAAAVMADFNRAIQSVEQSVNASPEDMARFTERIMELAKQEERGLRWARWRRFLGFCERLGAAALALPRTAPEFVKVFWHELRTRQEPAWTALGWGFVAAMALLSVGLFASAAAN